MPQQVAALKNVTLAYPAGNTAVDSVSFNLFSSEIVGLVGGNGSGKTSLLKIIAGYLPATSGGIELSGRKMEEYNERMLNDLITIVEQNPESQLTGPTVEDELARTCRLMGLKGRDIQDKVTRVLERMNISHARDFFMDEVSTGERRRVALALALLGNPRLLLLDEPFADLDQKGIKTTISIIMDYRKKGTCVLISSLKLDYLNTISDRIGVMNKGSLQMLNKPENVRANTKILQEAGIAVPV